MMDAAKLREAINKVDLAIAHLQAFHWDEAVKTIRATDWPSVRAAAEAHLATLPQTKMVEVWRVEWAERIGPRWMAMIEGDHRNEYSAKVRLEELKNHPSTDCIRVTGPHHQEVPA
jgi:hypothetical protein